MRKMLKKVQSEEGFDLVQILVAVAILAALSVVSVLLLLGQITKGENAATKANISNAITAAKIYASEHMDGGEIWPYAAATYVRKELGDPEDFEVWATRKTQTTGTNLLPPYIYGDLAITVHKADAADGGAVITPSGVVTRSGAAK